MWGAEYQALSSYPPSQGISHLTSPSHTLEHNRYFKRCHCHIVESNLSIFSHSSMPLPYWSYAFATTVYLINHMPTPTLQLSSPCLKLFQSSPKYLKFHVFRCLCYPWLQPYSSHKLAPRSAPCVFLGSFFTQSTYLCLEPFSSKIYTSCHVKFFENIFPFFFSSLLSSASLNRHSLSLVFSCVSVLALAHIISPPAYTLYTYNKITLLCRS